MNQPSAYHQIGRFITLFQQIEAALTEIIVLMARADDEAIRILVNDLEFNKKVKTTDVMFARFVDVRSKPDIVAKTEFHELMVELCKLGERRNDIVHSQYIRWTNVEGAVGLIRENSRLRSSTGSREIKEEELLPEAFNADFERLITAMTRIEQFRLKIIDWVYPEP